MTVPTERAARRAYRDSHDVWLGGVASGLAAHLGLPVAAVRGAFVVLALTGAGLVFYAGLWLTLPSDARFGDQAPGLAAAARGGRRPVGRRRLAEAGPVAAVVVVAIGLLLLVRAALGGQALVFWPLVLGFVGVALLWRQADEAQSERWRDASGRIGAVRLVFGRGGWASYARVAAGVLLVAGSLLVFGLDSGSLRQARVVVLAGLLGVVGLALVVGPWVLRLVGDLTAERSERIRSQERADVAAHLHDSVLQTLALIQKNAGDPAAVGRLARAQERDLRSWLFESPATGGSLAGALRAVAAEVEDAHGVVVDVVAVGDCPLTETVRPLVDASREAMTNAAKHAGTGRVDVYAEAGPGRAEVFVRDRGAGFDLDAVPPDRHGVRRSIVDRMARHGGVSSVRSGPETGTEVHLSMPLEES